MAEDKEYNLENHRHLLDFLIDANIRLVRGEYLHHLAREKRVWPRRQEAERETFKEKDGSVKTALVTLQEYKEWFIHDPSNYMFEKNRKYILSVSHCWEAKQHPDPFGFQARELEAQPLVGHWVFIDFICLPQYYRTPEEQVFFSKAMANMHVLYAHTFVDRIIQFEKLADEKAKASPPHFIEIFYEEEGAEPGSGKFGPQPFSKLELNDTPYHERGWCEAEKQWMCTKTAIDGYAPMTPARFREGIERGHQNLPDGLVLKFTHRSDEEIVVKLQEKIFVQQAHARKMLLAFQLPESKLLLLAETLPYFVNLEMVGFFDLNITETSAVALIEGLKTLRCFSFLDFSCHMEAKAARVLAQGLLECQFHGDLAVRVFDGPNREKLRHELRSLGAGRVDEYEHYEHDAVSGEVMTTFTIRPADQSSSRSLLGSQSERGNHSAG